MEPENNSNEEWQQPEEHLSEAPYVAQESDENSDQQPTMEQSPNQDKLVGEVKTQKEIGDHELEEDVDNGEDALLRWQSTEYVTREQNTMWYVYLALAVIALGVLAWFVFKSITFVVLIPVMAIALIVYIKRPPALLNYTLSRKGLHINDKIYGYDRFKAFGILQDGGVNSIVLLPRKRFQISQTLYFSEDIGEALVDMLAARLPMQDIKLDAIDKLLKKLRIN